MSPSLDVADWKTTTISSTKLTSKTTTTIPPETTTESRADNGSDETHSVVGKDSADINPETLQLKSVNDNNEVLFGQHATIALISTFLFITLVLILVIVAYKTKKRQERNQAGTLGGKKNQSKQVHSKRHVKLVKAQ